MTSILSVLTISIVLLLTSGCNNIQSENYFEKGVKNIENKKFNFAILNFKKSLAYKPNNAKAYNNIGISFHGLKLYDSSIFYYDRAIEMKPNDASFIGNRGIAKNDKNDITGAISDYNQAISIDSNFAPFYNNRGFTYLKVDKVKEAKYNFLLSHSIDPEDEKPIANLIGLNYKIKDYEKAIEWCDYYIEKFGFNKKTLKIKSKLESKIENQNMDSIFELEIRE